MPVENLTSMIMNRKLMFAALTSALTFINAESAVVKGMITDNSTHEPLIGATVKTDSAS